MRVEGKKESKERLDLMPTVKQYECPKCKGELVKLRTASEDAKVNGDFKVYWICVCSNDECTDKFRNVKVYYATFREIEYPSIGSYPKDRR